MHIQRLENQLRQLTGRNEELQYRNRQLEERLRELGAGCRPGAPAVAKASVAACLPRTGPSYGQPRARAPRSRRSPAMANSPRASDRNPSRLSAAADREPRAHRAGAGGPRGGRHSDVFDPDRNLTRRRAEGARRRELPMPAEASVGPGGRGPGEPLELSGSRYQQQGTMPPQQAAVPQGARRRPCRRRRRAISTAPRRACHRAALEFAARRIRSRHRLHAAQGLRAGRRDHARFRAEISERRAGRRFPDWLGESFFQRQQYRDAAETFLNVTSKYEKSAKAPDSLLRLGQSLAAFKEKEPPAPPSAR